MIAPWHFKPAGRADTVEPAPRFEPGRVPAQRVIEPAGVPRRVSGHVDTGRFACGPLDIAPLDIAEAVALLVERARSRTATAVHLCNTYTLKLARDSKEYRAMLGHDGLNLADGVPLAWVARRLGHAHLTQPVRGPSLMDAVIRDGLSWGAVHYFYGSTPEVIGLLARVLPQRYPGVRIAGFTSPPFRPLTDVERAATRDLLAGSGAHFVWVGLGTPKQDVFVHDFTPGSAAVLVAIGAAFDFAAGTIREAPRILHGSGLEWLFRLAREPRRLIRRYADSATLIPCLWRAAQR